MKDNWPILGSLPLKRLVKTGEYKNQGMTRKTDIRSFSARYLSLRRVPLLLLIDTVRRLECENSVGRPIKIVVNSSQELRFCQSFVLPYASAASFSMGTAGLNKHRLHVRHQRNFYSQWRALGN